VDPKDYLVIDNKGYGVIYLSIQFEYINPFLDMRTNITNALYDLVVSGAIPWLASLSIKSYIHTHLENFVWQLSVIEIFFLFREKDIGFEQNEMDPSIPNEQKHLRHVKDSVYSNEQKTKKNITWELILYNKANELRTKRKHVDEVYKVYPRKLEFKFYKNHTGLLSLKSILDLNVAEVIDLYSLKMASLFKKDFWGYVFIDTEINPVFTNILKMARTSTPMARGKLKAYKANEIPKLTRADAAYFVMMMWARRTLAHTSESQPCEPCVTNGDA
jgi:hypothetical protein